MNNYFWRWIGIGVLTGIVLGLWTVTALNIVSVGIGFAILAGITYGGGLAGLLVGGLILGAALACVKLRDHFRARKSNESVLIVNNSQSSMTAQFNATAKQNPHPVRSEAQKPGSFISIVYEFENMLFKRENTMPIDQSKGMHHAPHFKR